jgi:two-component system LytT family response regulator
VIRVVMVEDEPLVRERLRTLLGAHADAQLVAECADGAEAVTTILRERPDVVLLDIQLPELDGFGVLNALPHDARPRVIFVTAYDQYAIAAFGVNAVDYLLKPVEATRFDQALNRARLRGLGQATEAELEQLLATVREKRGFPDRVVVRTGSTARFVNVPEIQWIEARGNYLRLHLLNARHLVRETLRDFAARLDPARFVRIHRSIVVNLDAIASVEPHFHGEYVLTLRTGQRLQSSRTYSAGLRALLRE